MANGTYGAVLRQVQRLFQQGTVAGLGEGQLLDRFVHRGDELAFESLVARHGPMVLGVCRQLLHDPNDVEDAFQATFLVLVRKAGAIQKRDLLGAWLYGVAHRVAVRARQQAKRREPLNEDLAQPPSPCDVERAELRTVLHDELNRLPEKYRAPIVLCYLEGLSHVEAAERLHWPVGTVRGRMARGRDILRNRLIRHGLSLSTGAVAALVTSETTLAGVPEPLARSTARAAVQFEGEGTLAGAVSARAILLTQGVLSAMFWNKLRLGAATLLAAGLFTAGAGVLAQQGAAPGAGKAGRQAVAETKDEDAGGIKQINVIGPPELKADANGTTVTISGEQTNPVGERLPFHFKIERDRAANLGMTVDDVMRKFVAALNSSAGRKTYNFWRDPVTQNQYSVGVQHSGGLEPVDWPLDVAISKPGLNPPVLLRDLLTIEGEQNPFGLALNPKPPANEETKPPERRANGRVADDAREEEASGRRQAEIELLELEVQAERQLIGSLTAQRDSLDLNEVTGPMMLGGSPEMKAAAEEMRLERRERILRMLGEVKNKFLMDNANLNREKRRLGRLDSERPGRTPNRAAEPTSSKLGDNGARPSGYNPNKLVSQIEEVQIDLELANQEVSEAHTIVLGSYQAWKGIERRDERYMPQNRLSREESEPARERRYEKLLQSFRKDYEDARARYLEAKVRVSEREQRLAELEGKANPRPQSAALPQLEQRLDALESKLDKVLKSLEAVKERPRK